ncbi:MAG: glutamine--fructose-6-phosphate transaminase (isomerizing) [Parachlamydiaceae bacterium]
MCGIFGYSGPRNKVETVLSGLKKLEYRGYDSAGIAGIKNDQILYCKEVGKIAILEDQVQSTGLQLDIAIAQTRWATHGKPNRINAHPHFDSDFTIALVHNGIIENHEALRLSLQAQGIVFSSTTDTEVIAHLIASHYRGNILEAIQRSISELEGAFAITFIHVDYPHCIFGIAHESPLAIGLGQDEVFIASDSTAFGEFTDRVIYLSRNEIAVVSNENVTFYNSNLEPITKPIEKLHYVAGHSSKGDYEHFTLKEIFEQPITIANTLFGRLSDEYGTVVFSEEGLDQIDFLAIRKILILACGSSWHAGYIAAYMIEDKARIPVQLEISSEFRYKNPIVEPGTLVIAISQSGETADTISAVRELQAKEAKVLAMCNVVNSTLAREADAALFLRAGPEIGVCSTKAFTNQLVVLSLLALMLARIHHMTKEEGQQFIQALRILPSQVQQILDKSSHIEAVAKKYARYDNFFFLGRRYMFPTSLEGALKLKEISYINANGYPAGEMKHGPIALINESCPTVALCANETTFSKLLSNLMEVKARNGLIIAITSEQKDVSSVADDIILIPHTIDPLAPILVTIVTQLLAYYVAKERGAEIDQPRNLAKSVTVE